MQSVTTRVGRRRTLVIPKRIADALGIGEGTVVVVRVEGDRLVVEPKRDAVWLALHGKKVARITLEELERESLERQEELGGPG